MTAPVEQEEKSSALDELVDSLDNCTPEEAARFAQDNDSLYVMPLRIVPFETAALRRGRLIRNAMFKPAIEVYLSDEGASGQILIEDITPDFACRYFGWGENKLHPDYALLHKLARLTSYDIYSLRILFREHDIPVESVQYLQLSDEMKEKLDSYMQAFSRPLIQHVYGDEDVATHLEADAIVRLFRDPDTDKAMQRLRKLADSLALDVADIPAFLENFADVYLSISYYQHYLDDIVPKMVDVVTEIDDLKSNWQMKRDPSLMNTCQELTLAFGDITSSTTGRFETFYKLTDRMWENLSAESFRQTEEIINGYRTTIAGVLCGLGIKINAWKQRFPRREVGGPQARAEFMISSILPGMGKIKAIDEAMPLEPDSLPV